MKDKVTELTRDDIDDFIKRMLEDSERIQEHNYQVYLERRNLTFEEYELQEKLDK